MTNRAKTIFSAGLLIFFLWASTTSSPASPSSAKLSSNIVSFMPDFYNFWEKAKDMPLEERISLWNSLFEDKHNEFYRSVIYMSSGQDAEKVKARLLPAFLQSLQDADVQRMKDMESLARELIPGALQGLAGILPEESGIVTHYILPSLNTTSGSARPFQGDMVVYYGLEILSKFKKPADIKAVIAHESFHVLHFRHLFPYYKKKYGEGTSLFSAMMGEGLLFLSFMEGLTVYAIERAYPEVSRPGIIEKNVPLYEENFVNYARAFLNDQKEFSFPVYQKYFIDGAENPAMPEKFGYWIGYSIVKSLAKEYALRDMMTWLPEQAVDIMKREMEKMIAPSLLGPHPTDKAIEETKSWGFTERPTPYF